MPKRREGYVIRSHLGSAWPLASWHYFTGYQTQDKFQVPQFSGSNAAKVFRTKTEAYKRKVKLKTLYARIKWTDMQNDLHIVDVQDVDAPF